MQDTKENIRDAALALFARDGYEAVSVSDIAGALGMTKGALYKHYKNKRDVFDSIVSHMEALDAVRAAAYALPTDAPAPTAAYADAPFSQIAAFTLAQFHYWTAEPFSSSFRRLLTLEQYRSPEMNALYQQYLCMGPLRYTEALFCGLIGDREAAKRLALDFYAPVYFLYGAYDSGMAQAEIEGLLNAHIERFAERFSAMQKDKGGLENAD